MKGHGAETGSPSGLVDIKLGIAHALDSAGDHHVGIVGLHQHTGVQNRLKTGGTAAVKLVAGDLDGQSRLERRQPANGRVLAAGVTVPQDDVVHPGRVQFSAVQGLFDYGAGQVGGGNIPQSATEVSDSGPHRGHNGYFTHETLLSSAGAADVFSRLQGNFR